MELVEVLERRGRLRHHRWRVRQFHAADLVAPECAREALGYSAAPRAASQCVNRLEAIIARHAARLDRDVGIESRLIPKL